MTFFFSVFFFLFSSFLFLANVQTVNRLNAFEIEFGSLKKEEEEQEEKIVGEILL